MEKLNISENARCVLARRYLKKDDRGESIETAEDMFSRVAKTIASADELYSKSKEKLEKTEKDFYEMMVRLEFMPNSPTLMNAGRELGQLSACFVLPIEDSMESIFDAIKSTALIHKSGGGTGFSFSRLRQKCSIVKSTGGIASGPISFLKVFDAATQAVKQGGTRRGANMGILRVDHPDILEFISCKESDKDITNFNISVAVTERFIQRVENNEEYDLIDPHTKKVTSKINAREVFEKIVQMAWKNGEPGILFLDRINRDNPTPKLGEIESTNPCGEQPILPYESCNLGSINISKMVLDGEIDWDKLERIISIAVHFLDNVIDLNKFPLAEIEEKTKLTRKIGLGIMGWGSLLVRLGIPYNSEEAVKLAEKVMAFISHEAKEESKRLAKERGAFPAFEGSVYDSTGSPKLRNATLTTIAPTGTISIIAGPCSSGIEPMFAISYYRNVMDDDKLVEVDPLFEEIAKERGFYSSELMEKIANEGGIQKIEDIPEDVRNIFVTAHDIAPQWHIRMQAAFQKYVDNACSKTVNFSADATIDDVREAYMLAYKLGCKGVTIYRDQSRDEQVLNVAHVVTSESGNTEEGQEQPLFSGKISPKPRPKMTQGTTTKIGTGCGSLYVTINVDNEGLPFEIFNQMGKAGGCASSQLEAVARLVSLALRSGLDVKSIIDQLRGIRCPSPAWEKGGRIFSCADAIAKVIEDRLGNGAREDVEIKVPEADLDSRPRPLSIPKGNVVGVCPDCGGALRHQEGCVVCGACGYSKC